MTDTRLATTEADIDQFVSAADDASRPATFKHVLVGVDGTCTGRDAIALAKSCAIPTTASRSPTSFPSRLRDIGIFTPHLPGKTHATCSIASGPPRA